MKTSVMMRCPKCEKTSELDNLHLLDRSFKREWVGLTDEEIDGLHMEVKVRLMGTFDTKDIYRAIEAKLKEKNSA